MRRRNPIPVASRPRPTATASNALNPVRGKVLVAWPVVLDELTVVVLAVGVALVADELPDAGVPCEAGGELVELGGGAVDVGAGADEVVLDVLEDPSGSVYWLSPAEGPVAKAAAAPRRAGTASAASKAVSRKKRIAAVLQAASGERLSSAAGGPRARSRPWAPRRSCRRSAVRAATRTRGLATRMDECPGRTGAGRRILPLADRRGARGR